MLDERETKDWDCRHHRPHLCIIGLLPLGGGAPPRDRHNVTPSPLAPPKESSGGGSTHTNSHCTLGGPHLPSRAAIAGQLSVCEQAPCRVLVERRPALRARRKGRQGRSAVRKTEGLLLHGLEAMASRPFYRQDGDRDDEPARTMSAGAEQWEQRLTLQNRFSTEEETAAAAEATQGSVVEGEGHEETTTTTAAVVEDETVQAATYTSSLG